MTYKEASKDDLISVRKTAYDQLWHVVYRIWDGIHTNYRETYDRVSKDEALKVAETLDK